MAIMTTIEGCNFSDEVSFEELFGRVFKIKFPDDYNSIIENYNTVNIKFDKDLLLNFKNNLVLNSWYKYYKGVLEIETWIDFENELEKALEGISTVFNNLKNVPAINFNFYDKNILKVFCEFEHFEFSEEISRESSRFCFSEKFLDSKNMRIKEDKVLKSMYDSLHNFTIIFNRYLVDIVDVFYKEFKINSKISFNEINKIYTSNYTPTLEKLYNINKANIIYFHGKISKDDTNQNLILGVSEITGKVKENKMYNFSKQFQKIIHSINYKFIEIPKQKNNLEETIFYIIGHSLDKSDKEYVLDLFKFLENDTNKKSKICVFYYNYLDRESKLKNLFHVVGELIISEMNKEGRLYFTELTDENLIIEFNKKLEGRKINNNISYF